MARSLLVDAAIAVAAGVAATRVMDFVTTKIYDAQSEESKADERAASSEPAYQGVARRVSDAVGVHLTDQQSAKAGTALHWSLGAAAVPLYRALRRFTALSVLDAGLLTGGILFVGVDETLPVVLGAVPGPRSYPLVTHLRGLAGHATLGASLGFAVELGRLFTGRVGR